MHLGLIQNFIKSSSLSPSDPITVVGTFVNGALGAQGFEDLKKKGTKIDLITLDIRMPTMDGLSALVLIRKIDKSVKVIMASSEDENTVTRKSNKVVDMPVIERMALLKNVVNRIESKKLEAGKINFILDACEELHLNPFDVAKHLGANGYLHKPYTLEKTKAVLAHVMSGGSFVAKVG